MVNEFPSDPTVLLLGGTGEAREVAAWAVAAGVGVVSSLAGRVRNPRLPVGQVRVGGFGGVGGLAEYLRSRGVRAVVDATHPFAKQISANAVKACAQEGVPHLMLRRPGWVEQVGDRWHRVPDPQSAAGALATGSFGSRVLLTTGRQGLAVFTGLTRCQVLARCVDPPDFDLPQGWELLLARGPFSAEAEEELLRSWRADVLVTKDSGGSLTVGKLSAARSLGLPVLMVDRPAVPAGVVSVHTVPEACAWLQEKVLVSG